MCHNETFAIFVVQSLAPTAPPHTQHLLHQIAQHYILGQEKNTQEKIETLSLALEKDGKFGVGDDDDGKDCIFFENGLVDEKHVNEIIGAGNEAADCGVEKIPDVTASQRRTKRTYFETVTLETSLRNQGFMMQESMKEDFRTDLAKSLTEILNEYLSSNWNNMEELIKINNPSIAPNSKAKNEESGELDAATAKNKEAWRKFKKGFFRHMISNNLATTRSWVTMVEILKSIKDNELTPEVKLARETLFQSYPPTILFLGGGMGAGKSTVVSLLKKKQEGAFFIDNPLIIEADALKMIDPIFQKLNIVEQGSNEVSQVVHGHSTEAANRQILAALAAQRTIVVDGTMTWMPFVQQTIEMVRKAHRFQYHLGPGYQVHEDGSVIEKYWVLAHALESTMDDGRSRLPYRVEMVGVTVDPEKAVARGLRRKLITDRGVPIKGQLRSHRLYSENFEPYLDLFDKVSLYDTSGKGDPQLVAMQESGQPLLVEPKSYNNFLKKKQINDDAMGVQDLYLDGTKVEFDRQYCTPILEYAFLGGERSTWS